MVMGGYAEIQCDGRGGRTKNVGGVVGVARYFICVGGEAGIGWIDIVIHPMISVSS